MFNPTYFKTFKVWINGPALITPRYDHSCAKIRKNTKDSSLSIIVVGGYHIGLLTSVEILDENSSTWRIGPYLPVGSSAHGIVEDPRGGVILIGGYVRNNLLYRLKDGGLNSNWELMPQKLKVANYYFAVMIIPDKFVQNCTIN